MYSRTELDNIIFRSICGINFNKEPKGLYEPLEYMISIGGKRLRPRLCLTAYNLFRDDIDEEILGPSVALEIFHNFTLLHDDIMDRSDTRRGQLTVHKKWNENTAILSGDVMSIMAYQYLARYKGERRARVLEMFSDTAAKVCEGQQYDMEFEDLPFITMDDYMNMIGLKTAVLIACSAGMGAVIAGASDEQADAIYQFAYQIGLAFQITDDYLDTFGNQSVFGKKIGGDIRNNKKTWLLVESFRVADSSQRTELDRILRMGESEADSKIEAMKEMYQKLGVREAALVAIEDYHKKAMEALAGKGFSAEQKAQLKDFAEELVHREG